MDWLYLIGRILFAMIFVGSAMGHFTQTEATAQYAESRGVTSAKMMGRLTGVIILLGGLSVLLGVWMEIGTWLLILFLLAAAFKVHTFWTVADPMQKSMEMAQFMKNLSMAGGGLILYWMVQTSNSYGPFALGQPM